MNRYTWFTLKDKAVPHWYKIQGWLPNRYLPLVMFDSICIYKPNMKGGHRRNAIYNAFHRIVFRSKNARQIDPKTKQEFREIFEMQVFGGMNPWNRINFLDILKKGKHFKQAKKK